MDESDVVFISMKIATWLHDNIVLCRIHACGRDILNTEGQLLVPANSESELNAGVRMNTGLIMIQKPKRYLSIGI
jgi:hypothetical protein